MIGAAFLARKLFNYNWNAKDLRAPSSSEIGLETNFVRDKVGPIRVDLEKRDAILEAFKVGYCFFGATWRGTRADVALVAVDSTRTIATSGMRGGSMIIIRLRTVEIT